MKAQIINALLQAQAYPEPTRAVHLIQTHVSFLFITDAYVYKIKKPVDFGFLNFTTLDKRLFFCREEVRLNRRLCPDIYLGVVEVRESADGASFTGDGTVIDYAVKMKRLPEERMLDRLLSKDEVTADDMRRIARAIGEFHRDAERSAEIDAFGSVESIKLNWEENFQQLAPFVGITIRERDLLLIREWVGNFLDARKDLFEARIAQGFIRDCDGDIHLENICLTEERVHIFDCIEFNNRFRYSDTAADVAFLLMDLDFHGSRLFDAIVVDEYIAVTGDRDLALLLDFYKAYRAVVRSKVEGFRLNDPLISESGKMDARDKAARYFRLARGYVLRSRLPSTLILTCGLMGSGKSAIASALSFELGIETVSSDRVRKERAAVPEFAHEYAPYGTGIYDRAGDEATYAAMLERAEQALAANRSIIIDATFRRKADRLIFRELARRYGLRYVLIVTHCSEELARQRLDERTGRPRELSDGRWELYHRQMRDFEMPLEHEEYFTFIDTSLSINDNINTILHEIGLI